MKINEMSNGDNRHVLQIKPSAMQECKDTFVKSENPANLINVRCYTQDPLVSDPVEMKINAGNIAPGPDNERIDVDNTPNPDAQPDDNGNMLYETNDPRFLAVHTFSVVKEAIERFEKYLGRKIEWAFDSDKITVYPDRGEMLNAYYNRSEGALSFFHKLIPQMNKTVFSGSSSEVCAHELGHATLDALRPGYLSSFTALEPRAFHESFSDICAILDALSKDQVLNMLEAQTGGDLRKQNLVAYIAEELGKAAYIDKPNHDYLRNALNKLTWKPPSTLPQEPEDDNELGKKPHNYSRLFTGAFYEILTGIYDGYRETGLDFRQAINQTRDTAYKLLVNTINYSPVSMNLLKDIYKSMLKADKKVFDGKYGTLIEDVFTKRKITQQSDLELPVKDLLPDLSLPASVKNPAVFQEFVDKYKGSLGLPLDAKLKNFHASKDETGDYTALYSYKKELKLTGTKFGELENAYVDLEGGLNLEFDSKGKLSYRNFQAVTTERERECLSNIENFIKSGDILITKPGQKVGSLNDFIRPDGTIYKGYTVYENNKVKILPVPVID